MTLAERGVSSILYRSIKTFLSLWDISGQGEIRTYCLLGVLGHFGLSIKFSYVKLSWYFPIYILFTKRIETFWCRNILNYNMC